MEAIYELMVSARAAVGAAAQWCAVALLVGMAVLETATRNALADQIDTLVNTGAGTATAVLETSGDAEVATFDLQNPAFGAAAAGVITLQGVPLEDTNATGGTVEHMSIYDRDGTKILEAVAGTSGTEVIMTSLTVAATETVTLTSLTITVPVGS